MVTLSRNLRRRPARLLEDTRDAFRRPLRTISRRPYASTGGLLLLLVTIFGFIAIFPEIHRYVRVRRM